MSNTFLIVITDPVSCSLKRLGESGIHKFSSVAEALAEARQRLDGTSGQVTITDPAAGEVRMVNIEATEALPV